jgi:hypothetical protein
MGRLRPVEGVLQGNRDICLDLKTGGLMAVTEIKEFKDDQLEELAHFLYKNGYNHPELGNKELLLWTRGYRFLSTSKGEITGYIAQIPQKFIYGRKSGRSGTEDIGWSVTLVLKDFGDVPDAARRRTAFTHELLSKVENNPPWRFAAVGVVPEIEEFYRIRGHIVRRDCSKMYARVLRPGKFLSYLNKPELFSFPLSTANLIFRPQKNPPPNKIKKISSFDSSWDSLWDSMLFEKYELYGRRDAEFLNYKLSQPGKDYITYLHLEGGYIIIREARHFTRDLYIMKICDLVGTDAARADLIGMAIDHAAKAKVYGIVALGSISDESFYKECGLFVTRSYVITLPPDITAKMHVTFFDADLDNLW